MNMENNYSKYAFKYVIQGIRKKGFIFLVDVSHKPTTMWRLWFQNVFIFQ